MDQLPFAFPEIYSGFAAADGVATITPEGLRLEYEKRDALLGVFRSGVQQFLLPWSDLAGVTLKTEFLGGAVLRLRATSLTAIGPVPGREAAEIVLKIARPHRHDAVTFADRLRLRLADQNIADVMARLEQITR